MIVPNRLLVCASFVRPNTAVADIGTDHGLLACHLGQKGHRVVAADVNPMPLQRAKESIRKYQMEEQVQTRLSDGLQQVKPEEAEDIIIAGMGGELIFSLILACSYTKQVGHRLILQPMTQVDTLRRGLAAEGFSILDETALEEKGHFYTILCVEWTGQVRELTMAEALGGAHLHKTEESSSAYLSNQRQRLQKIMVGLEQTKDQQERIETLRAVVEALTPQ